jgi:hypothetical protein
MRCSSFSYVLLVALVTGALVALRRYPVWGFSGPGFLSSSRPAPKHVPLVTQTVAEHRMYLSLAALMVALVLLLYRGLDSRPSPGLALAVGAGALTSSGTTTIAPRWRSGQATMDQVPGNARAHSNIGLALADAGRAAEAIDEQREALRLQPGIPFAH